jgi:hypothetical protein
MFGSADHGKGATMVFPWGTLFLGSLLAPRGPKGPARAEQMAEKRRITATRIREEEAQAAREALEAKRHAGLLSAL